MEYSSRFIAKAAAALNGCEELPPETENIL